jgi:hypothetical protein
LDNPESIGESAFLIPGMEVLNNKSIDEDILLLKDYTNAYVQSFKGGEAEVWARLFLKKMLQLRQKSNSTLLKLIMQYFFLLIQLLKSGPTRDKFQFRKTYEALFHALEQWAIEVLRNILFLFYQTSFF